MTPVNVLHLVYLSAIDVQVGDALRLGRELRGHGGDAIIKTCAHGDQEIAVVHGVVRECGAVHAKHAHRQALRRIE